jgi:hypothetical protein
MMINKPVMDEKKPPVSSFEILISEGKTVPSVTASELAG